MGKPVFQFYFADEPQFATKCDRAWLAHALRAYRKRAGQYVLTRVGVHWYTVQVRGGSAVAVIIGQKILAENLPQASRASHYS